MRETHYQDKSLNYGIAHTRRNRILSLAGDIKGKRVLDIGCAKGYLGAKFKEKGNYVAGVEISEKAAKEAEKVLDRVYVFDLEKEWPSEIMSEKFDLIIMAEVLEHVFDPKEILKNVNKILVPGGKIIITTPNFMIWLNRIKFIFGRFAYTDEGIFDFGHIRFFTYPYLKEVLAESGFKVDEEKHIIYPGKLTRFLKSWPGIFAHQFIVSARKLS